MKSATYWLLGAALALTPVYSQAADPALVYNKTYPCGTELVHVAYCRRDSDRPGHVPTPDAENYCHVYYLDRPKNKLGGDAFGTELRGDLEKRLRACGALAAVVQKQPAAAPGPARADGGQASLATPTASGEIARGRKLYESKEFERALVAFQAAVPLARDAKTAARAHWWKGSAYRELDRLPEAIASMREAQKLEPGNADIVFNLGYAQHLAGKYQDALASLKESARLDAQDAETHYWIGETHRIGFEKFEPAMAAFRESLRLRPNDARTINQIGLVHAGLRQDPAALAAFQEAVRLKPAEPLYLSNLSLQYAHMGKFDEADSVSQTLRRINPKKADELEKALLEIDIANAINGKPKP